MDLRNTSSLDINDTLRKIELLEAGIDRLYANASRGVNIPTNGITAALNDLKLLEDTLARLKVTTVAPKIAAPNTAGITAQLSAGSNPLAGLPGGQAVKGYEDLLRVIAELTAALREINVQSAVTRTAMTQIDPAAVTLARAIKQLSTEWKSGKGDAAEYANQMRALKASAENLAAGELLGSRSALVLATAIGTASRALGDGTRAASASATEVERLRVAVLGTRAEYQSHNATAQQTVQRLQELYQSGQRLTTELPRESAEWLKLQQAMRTAAATMDSIKGKTPLLGLEDAVGRAVAKNGAAFQALLLQFGSLGGPIGGLLNQVSSFTLGMGGLSAAEIAALAPTAALASAFLALGAALAASVEAAIPFEAGLSQLRALTGLSKEDIADLGQQFQELSRHLPITSNQLVEIARNAALVGVHGKEEVGQFTEIMAQLGILLRDTDGNMHDLEGTSRELAKFLNAAGIAGDAFIPALRESASELVTLKTRIGGTIPEILNMSSYLVSIGTKMGLTTAQVLALSSAIAATGGKAQASGHAIARIIEEMQEASIHGGKAADEYARIMGLTAEQFKSLVLNSPAEAFKLLAGSIDLSTKNGASIAQVFADLGIKNVRLKQTIAEAAVAFPKLSQALGIAADASNNQGALASRAAIATDNYRDRVKKLEDSITAVAQSVGLVLLPKLSSLIDKVQPFVDGFGNAGNSLDALKSYADSAGVAIGGLTGLILLNTKAAKAMLAADLLGGTANLFRAVTSGAILSQLPGKLGVLTGGFKAMSEAARLEGAATGVRGLVQLSGGLGGFLRLLLAVPVAAVSIVPLVIAGLAGLTAYYLKVQGDILGIQATIEKNDQDSFQKTMERVRKLSAAGDELSKAKARALLAQVRLGQAEEGDVTGAGFGGVVNRVVDPEEVKRAQDAVTKANASLRSLQATQAGSTQTTKTQTGSVHEASEAFGELSDKLVDLSKKFGEVKLTTFESNLKSARDELGRFLDEVDRKYTAGDITGDEAKQLRARQEALFGRTAQTLVQRQLDEDTTTRLGHEREVQQAQLALVVDGRLKRKGQLDQELADVRQNFADQIKEALTNAKAAPDAASRRKFQNDAGQLQVQQAEQERLVRQKAAQDLDQIDQDRLKKAQEAQRRLLEGQVENYGNNIKLLEQQRDQELALAGESAEGKLAIERKYGPALTQLAQQQAQISAQVQRAALASTLQQQLDDARGAGTARAGLELAARQEYNQALRNLDLSTQASTNAIILAQDTRLRTQQLALYQQALDKQLAGVKDFSGAQLQAAERYLRAQRAIAVAAGDSGIVSAIDKGLKTLTDQGTQNLVKFREELTKSEGSAADLRTQLANIAQTPLEKALSSAAGPFNSILKSARDNLKSVNEQLSKVAPGDLNGSDAVRLRSQQAAQTRIILEANQGRNQALLTAQQQFDRERDDKAAAAALKLAKTQFDGQNIGEAAYDRLLDADRQYWTRRLAVAVKGSADEDAAQQHLADNQAERDRARQVIQGQQEDARTLSREELESSLKLAQSDQERARARQGLMADDQARLATVTAELAGLRATGGRVEDIAKLERERLAILGRLNDAHEQERQLTETLLKSQQGLAAAEGQRQAAMARTTAEVAASKAQAVTLAAGDLADVDRRIALARQEGDSQASINDLLTERAGKQISLYQAQVAAARSGLEVTQQQLDLDEARARAVAQLTGLAEDGVASARLDLDVTRRQLSNLDDQLARADERRLTEAEVNDLQVKRLGLLGQEAEGQRKLLEAQRARRDLVEQVGQGAAALQREAAGGASSPVATALQGLTDTRAKLVQATRAYQEAQADLNREQSSGNLQRFAQAQEALTGSISAQRKAVSDLASAYREQISSMDSVRDAADKLRGVTQGAQQLSTGDQFERLYAIQTRRDEALRQVQAAIRSGDAKLIASSTQELTAQQDRYNKQAEVLTKAGVQVTRQGDSGVRDVLAQLDKLGVAYDQEAATLQRRASAADREAQAAETFSAATDRLPEIFSTGAQQLQQALQTNLSTLLARPVPVSTPVGAGAAMNTYRGGDTINYNIETHVYPAPGQDITMSDVEGAVERGIDNRIGAARRERAWSKDC